MRSKADGTFIIVETLICPLKMNIVVVVVVMSSHSCGNLQTNDGHSICKWFSNFFLISTLQSPKIFLYHSRSFISKHKFWFSSKKKYHSSVADVRYRHMDI